jgi:signal transduction histidine kinase
VSDEFVHRIRSLPLHTTMIGATTDIGRPIVWQNTDYPNEQVREANNGEGIRSGISIPLLAKERLMGVVCLGARETRAITPEESSLLAAIGQQIGLAVENARLYEQAERSAALTERNRLARELHDSVTQSLYSVTLYAEAAAEQLSSGGTGIAVEHLRDLRDTAQEALREMRLLIFELRAPALEQSGLAAALQMRLEAVEARGGMQVELQVDGSETLARNVQMELYNIAQEALNNALKHALAHRVRVHLTFGDAVTCLEVCDDGVGFEPAIARLGGGFGISGMHERAKRIGGTLVIESAPGQGTRLVVQVPTKDPAPREGQGSSGKGV